jgi:hypothetical protein
MAEHRYSMTSRTCCRQVATTVSTLSTYLEPRATAPGARARCGRTHRTGTAGGGASTQSTSSTGSSFRAFPLCPGFAPRLGDDGVFGALVRAAVPDCATSFSRTPREDRAGEPLRCEIEGDGRTRRLQEEPRCCVCGSDARLMIRVLQDCVNSRRSIVMRALRLRA